MIHIIFDYVGTTNLWGRRTCGTDELVRRELFFHKNIPDQQADQSYKSKNIPDQQADQSYKSKNIPDQLAGQPHNGS